MSALQNSAADDFSSLAGRRVLLVEDETLVLMNLEDIVEALGCTIVGPAMRISRAMELLDGLPELDAAVLDVNLGGETIFPVAERLAERGIPMVFTTGYGREGLPADWHDAVVLQKPYAQEDLARCLREAIAQ